MIAKLTSKCGYPILVNFANVVDVEICYLNSKCDFEKRIDNEPDGLGLRITYVSDTVRIVRESLSDLKELGVYEV